MTKPYSGFLSDLMKRRRLRTISALVPLSLSDSFDDIVARTRNMDLHSFIVSRPFTEAITGLRMVWEDDNHEFEGDWSYYIDLGGTMLIVAQNELDAVYLRLKL